MVVRGAGPELPFIYDTPPRLGSDAVFGADVFGNQLMLRRLSSKQRQAT